MRADFNEFLKTYGPAPAPDEIWQHSIDCDPEDYRKLLALEPEELPSAYDFGTYSDDICFVEKVQPDLFAALIPLCLRTWHHEQWQDAPSDITGPVEVFTAALARRPLLKEFLTASQAEAVRTFMGNTLLDRIDHEGEPTTAGLSYPGKRALPFPWIQALGTYAVLFSTLEPLWRTWWRFDTPGQAVAALQYCSCLMYDYGQNPILAPTPPHQHHLWPPSLWETDSQVFDQGWQMENVLFVLDTVTPDYVGDALVRAHDVLDGVIDSPIPARLLADLGTQRPLLEHRLKALPEILTLPADGREKWPPLE